MLRRGLLAAPFAMLALPARAQARVVTDMAGRQVTLPAKIERVVTLGSLPVVILYSFFVDYYVSSMTGAVKE